jgi:hypothetical protein
LVTWITRKCWNPRECPLQRLPLRRGAEKTCGSSVLSIWSNNGGSSWSAGCAMKCFQGGGTNGSSLALRGLWQKHWFLSKATLQLFTLFLTCIAHFYATIAVAAFLATFARSSVVPSTQPSPSSSYSWTRLSSPTHKNAHRKSP